nr:MAG TPA: hypothetical protein [Caudoviricetes sp.]
MDEGDEVIALECGSKRFCHMTTAGFRKQAKRLTDTGAVEECVLLGIGECLAKLGENVILQLERIVVEQFLGHLDSDMELVRIQKDLCKGCVTERERAAFLDPRSGRRSRSNIDFMLTGCGDGVTELSHDVFLGKRLNEAGIILLGYEVAAVSVHTFTKDIAHLAEVAAKGGEHSGAVGIGRTTGLGLLVSGRFAVHGLLGDGSGSGSVQLRFHCGHGFHALDLGTVVLHFLFHLSIGLGILIGKQTVLVSLGFNKCLCGVPSLVALFTQFIDSHIELPPVFNKIEPIHKVIGFLCTVGFRVDGALCGDFLHEGIHHIRLGIQHGNSRCWYIFRFRVSLHDSVCKAEFHSLICVHPSFGIHEVRELGTGKPRLDFIGIDNGILDAAEHLDGFLHFLRIAECRSHGVVDHKHGHGRYQHLCACHSDDGRCGCGNTVNLDRHIALVIHEHIVNLRRSHAVAAGAVDPHGDVSAAGHQLIFEKLRGDIIVKPAFLGDGSVQEQRSFRCLRLVLPIPKFLHRFFPPFRHRWVYLQKHPHFSAGAYCR